MIIEIDNKEKLISELNHISNRFENIGYFSTFFVSPKELVEDETTTILLDKRLTGMHLLVIIREILPMLFYDLNKSDVENLFQTLKEDTLNQLNQLDNKLIN